MEKPKQIIEVVSISLGEISIESSKNTLKEIEECLNRIIEKHSDYLIFRKTKKEMLGVI